MAEWEGAKLLAVTSRRRLRKPLLAMLALLAVCAEPPIQWGEAVPGTGPEPPVVPESPSFHVACPTSIRLAPAGGRAVYAAWWELRPDSTAELRAAYSADGRSWSSVARVDTMDSGRTGCRRPAPAIAAEGGHVYLVYGMAAREGPGIFASHSMDYGKLFHAPVAVVYGERFGLTAVASRGNTVVVAYEDPNTVPRRIGLAVSNTMGHPFQINTLASPPTGEASAPWVQVRDSGVVRVGWTRVIRGDTARVVREGRIR
jgi:hypothetical protein